MKGRRFHRFSLHVAAKRWLGALVLGFRFGFWVFGFGFRV